MHAAQNLKLQPSDGNTLNISAWLILHWNVGEGRWKKNYYFIQKVYEEPKLFLISVVKLKGELWHRSDNTSWLMSQH